MQAVLAGMTDLESLWLETVRETPCVLCWRLAETQESRTTAHHTTVDRAKAKKAPHLLAAALCYECHQGSQGIHGDKSRLKRAKVGELQLVADTAAAVLHKLGVRG